MKGSAVESPRRALFYGNDEFIDRTLEKLKLPEHLSERPNVKRVAIAKSLDWYGERYDRNNAIEKAWETGAYTLQQIGAHFGVRHSSVSRILAKERRCAKRKT